MFCSVDERKILKFLELKETQTLKAIKWNHTNIALLLQEATHKYQKLMDY